MITYGPCADGQCRVATDNKVIATPYADEEAARRAAEQMAAGRRIVRTVFAGYGAKIAVDPGHPSGDRHVEETWAQNPDKPGEWTQVDLSPLDLSIPDLYRALATGDHDAHLDALEAAEEAGKTRKGALSAIAGRREVVG